ncbi:hypothetical protein BJ322DRAFT_1095414 [Thelephora terrestris]|uniref:C3H1-type domain-containing protein n=1 Tax=Thelephora terrestris TaxID=56493 RepID=A0A9P6L1A5_9AGAM|nr:hypothetical protein BJ322DRAFT_1095414 [Thelephora terrestris]
MDATQSEKYEEKLETWEVLLQQQSDLFRATIERNRDLEESNEELERQVDVWKKAHKSELASRRAAENRILELERKGRSLTEGNPLVLCLVDGDGNIFSPELISAGHTGGAQAATLLNRGIMEHLKTLADIPTKNPQIWLTIYCNLNGLRDTVTNHHHCTAEQYDAFIEGFNKAAPLFSIVDVGSSKEAADTKLKESLRVFTCFPQIVKVYFGGLHDNGYTTTLSHLQTEGLLDKLVFLRGYNEIAFQLRNYEIPECTIPGVFMTQKMPVKLNPRRFASGYPQAYPNPSPQPYSNLPFPHFQPTPSYTPPQPSPPFSPQMSTSSPFRLMSAPPSPSYAPQAITPPSPPLYLDPTLPLHKQNPPPCNFYYLSRCKDGHRCRFGHGYILTPEQLGDFRKNAKKYPCPIRLKGKNCEFGDDCCMGHVCPRGLNCTFLRQGKCKYSRPEMHIALPTAKWRGKKAQKQSIDAMSEMAFSESGFSQ